MKKKWGMCTASRHQVTLITHLKVLIEPAAEKWQAGREAWRQRIHTRGRGAHTQARVGNKVLQLKVNVADRRRFTLDNGLLARFRTSAGLVQLLLRVLENVLRAEVAEWKIPGVGGKRTGI